ncbi:MAG: ABC transporter permease [Symbiobacterium sp.]|uniref:Oligopeptide ABC transporter permease protein n=1 Tax=Symbiobacterium thermophilum (strain DSM 24528 / JCM 14929 / IAM 14863 / T) TaxID=292459 RepID=Q67SR0_SYMTH|nr:ABC transporter permease [Symbiobacterium thermophilum]BAD39283.1 oligopeptide ABC transporter permease protein [Symbiobacterium thermophilum IAM 14863]
MNGRKKNGVNQDRFGGVRAFFRTIWRNPMSRAGFLILLVFLLMAIFGPMFIPELKSDYVNRLQPPSWKHPLGTDLAGKDTLLQLILGSRNVLLVAAYAGLFTVLIATGIGVISGLQGGVVDQVLMLLTNVVLTMPSFPVTMILSMIIRITDPLLFGVVLSLWSWAGLAKAIRSQVLSLKHREFIEASRLLGISKLNIIRYDVLPNLVSYVAVNFISIMKSAITSSVGLMLLGLVPFQGNHWGVMIQVAISQTGALMGSATVVYFLAPVVCLMLFQLGCYCFANGLDEALNPRLRA